MITKKRKGFTLIELMMVMAIVGTVIAIAVPNIGEFIKNNRIKSRMFDLLNAINQARTEAVKRKDTIIICRSNDTDDAPTCAGDANTWTTGWIVYADVDDDGALTVDPDIVISKAIPAGGTVAIMSTADELIYNPDGTTDTFTRFAICDNRGEENGRQVNVALVGRAAIYSYPIDDCDAPTGP